LFYKTRYCQRGIIIGLLISVPLAVLWIFSSIFLQVIFRVDKKMADLSAEFIYGRLIGLPFITLFEVIRRFAQAQRLGFFFFFFFFFFLI
jgi:Na+-driven multidrug efflux pump